MGASLTTTVGAMTSPRRSLASVVAIGACLSVLALSLTACSEETTADQKPTSGNATETPSTQPSEDASSSTPTEEPSTPASTAAGATVPVYFVADTPQGARLFREFQRVSGDALLEAATLVDGGTSLDPDYRTEWPSVGIDSVSASDGLLVVDITGDGFTEAPDGMTKRLANLAIQQMVYTLQGVQQERVPVQFLREGEPARLFGLDLTEPVRNAGAIKVLGLVNVTTPEQGATVKGDTLEAAGVASSFEATVPWEIRSGNKVVLDGFATAEGWMNKLYPWQISIDVSGLASGDYAFVAMTDDPSGGTEGNGPTEDSKDFTLK